MMRGRFLLVRLVAAGLCLLLAQSSAQTVEQLEKRLRAAPPNDPGLRLDLSYDLGSMYIEAYTKSLEHTLLTKAITHFENVLECNADPHVGRSKLSAQEEYQMLNNLARSYKTVQQYDKALPVWKRIAGHPGCQSEIASASINEHPFIQQCYSMHMSYIVIYYLERNQPEVARQWFDKAVEFRYPPGAGDRGIKGVYWTVMEQVPPWTEPALRASAYWNPAEFAVTKILEENYKLVMEDLARIVSSQPEGGTKFEGSSDEEIVGTGSWTEFLLSDESGRWNKQRCATYAPNICRLLRAQKELFGTPPGTDPHWMPGQVTVLKLAPGTHLRLHTGPKNQRLTLHLGLTVPVGPTIRVGAEPGEVREWEEGKVIAFDDSFVHEVWHNGTKPRYVLYVSVWHPDMWQNAAARTAASVEALMGRSVAEHKRLCASIMDGSFKAPSPRGRKGRKKKDKVEKKWKKPKQMEANKGTDAAAERATPSSSREDNTQTDVLQLRMELQGFKLSQLQKLARKSGCDDRQLEAALDSDDPKQALVELIVVLAGGMAKHEL